MAALDDYSCTSASVERFALQTRDCSVFTCNCITLSYTRMVSCANGWTAFTHKRFDSARTRTPGTPHEPGRRIPNLALQSAHSVHFTECADCKSTLAGPRVRSLEQVILKSAPRASADDSPSSHVKDGVV